MRLRIVLFITAFTLCVSFPRTPASAQTSTTGTIEGTISDSNGAVVPSVTVTVTSPNLIQAQSATTDNEGRYRILNLPPGRYTVRVAATAGFASFVTSVDVNLSKTSTAPIQLEPAGAIETVTINSTSGAIVDTASNTSGTSVSTEQFSSFTTQRTVQSIYTIAPSVTRSGLRDASGRDRDPSVAGSSGLENGYVLDGVNTTDPAFGGSGANLPFEFVQEVEIKTGAYGAEYGLATGGIFNVLTKSGGNDLHGDIFAYFTTKGLVRATKYLPFTGPAPNGFSELDAGFDLGGPIKKDKLWFFAAFNPQRRESSYFTQTLHQTISNKITTPFYAGKLTYALNQRNTLTFSTFADFTKIKGFRTGNAVGDGSVVLSGFGADLNSFMSNAQLFGGSNYAVRLNSTITSKWIGEFAFGSHFQRSNSSPVENLLDKEPVTDNFAIVRSGAVLPVTDTNVDFGGVTGFLAFVDGRGGSLERNFVRGGGPGRVIDQDRNRYEFQARLQNIVGPHTLKYGFEFTQNRYRVNSHLAGPTRDFGAGVVYDGFFVSNNFGVCTVQAGTIVCPAGSLTNRVNALIDSGQAPAGITIATTNTGLTAAQLSINPFLIRSSTLVGNSIINTRGNFITTNVESFYLQDDFQVTKDMQINLGLRWDYQQLRDGESSYLKLNSFKNNLQPRLGLIWDFTSKGKGKVFVNYARFLEAPMPVSFNLFAGGNGALDQGVLVNRLNAPAGSTVTVDTGSCCGATPVDADLKPQTVNEYAAGMEYEVARDLVLGVRGVYRAQGTVIEDGSFDEGLSYFVFNPGESSTERQACASEFGCFGRARRYYRALEFTAIKRFTTNYQFIASYVYSSLIGNYEGFYRNDHGQALPNFSSLFDLQSLLANTYGRLPNDRPGQLKFDGSYRTPWKLLVSGSFRAQSGIPFSALIPHPIYGNNHGFAVPRGTAINPVTGQNRTPATFNLDLGGYYPVKLAETRQLRIQVDWFNVFNSQRAVRQDETERIGSGIPGAGFIQFPNPFYGQGTIFQYPSSIRLGIKFQF